MHRTTILLSHELRREAQTEAQRRGVSLSALIRQQLLALVRGQKSGTRAGDPLFRPRNFMRRGNPTDIAAKHDDYLYGQRAKPAKK